jgi:hypothetical protein
MQAVGINIGAGVPKGGSWLGDIKVRMERKLWTTEAKATATATAKQQQQQQQQQSNSNSNSNNNKT